MSVRYTGRASGADMADMEDWWGEGEEAQSRGRQMRPRPRAQNLPEQLKQTRPDLGRARRRKAQAVNRVLMYMTLAVLAVCLFMQVNRYAQIASSTKQISTLVGQIKQLENDRANLELRLSARESVQRVRNEAMYNLGMDYPAEGQVRVVALKSQSAGTLAQIAAITAELAQ